MIPGAEHENVCLQGGLAYQALLLAFLELLGHRSSEAEKIILATIAVYLAGLWGSRASGWDRFYLNVTPIILAVAVARFADLPGMERRREVSVLCLSYALIHAIRMSLNLGD